MTTIIDTVKTYDLIDGDMVHTGYFIITNNYSMKWATKWVWESSIKSNLFTLNADRFIRRLENAQ